jgi:hypothetical protein
VLQLSRRHPLPKTPVTGLIWLDESPISPSLGSRDRLDSLPLGIAEFPSPSHALFGQSSAKPRFQIHKALTIVSCSRNTDQLAFLFPGNNPSE